jgi:hypothetical protein
MQDILRVVIVNQTGAYKYYLRRDCNNRMLGIVMCAGDNDVFNKYDIYLGSMLTLILLTWSIG